MTALSKQQDVWIPATATEKRKALAALAGLPSRQTLSAELAEGAFFVALEGVTRHALSEAVKAILRGALGHGFFPSPPELRMQCDIAMQPHIESRRRAATAEEQRQASLSYAETRLRNARPEARARVSAAYQRFMEQFTSADAEAEERRREEVRARYGLTPERMAEVPDNPKARERMGTAHKDGGDSSAASSTSS